ncbi:uncharacterized protein LOC144339580 [Macaca mulatta]
MFPRQVSNFWAQAILLPRPPKALGLRGKPPHPAHHPFWFISSFLLMTQATFGDKRTHLFLTHLQPQLTAALRLAWTAGAFPRSPRTPRGVPHPGEDPRGNGPRRGDCGGRISAPAPWSGGRPAALARGRGGRSAPRKKRPGGDAQRGGLRGKYRENRAEQNSPEPAQRKGGLARSPRGPATPRPRPGHANAGRAEGTGPRDQRGAGGVWAQPERTRPSRGARSPCPPGVAAPASGPQGTGSGCCRDTLGAAAGPGIQRPPASSPARPPRARPRPPRALPVHHRPAPSTKV